MAIYPRSSTLAGGVVLIQKQGKLLSFMLSYDGSSPWLKCKEKEGGFIDSHKIIRVIYMVKNGNINLCFDALTKLINYQRFRIYALS